MADDPENPQPKSLEGAVTRFIRFLFPRDPSKPPPKIPAWSRYYQQRELPFGAAVVWLIILFAMMIYIAWLQAHAGGR
jgi:hypothetical protein